MTRTYGVDPDLAQREELAMSLVPMAMRFAGIVRDEDVGAVRRFLAGVPDLAAFAVVLAAMVPVDRPRSELLAWTAALEHDDQPPVRDLARYWTDSAVNRHHSVYVVRKRGGHPIDELTEAGHREWNRRRMARTRARERGAA